MAQGLHGGWRSLGFTPAELTPRTSECGLGKQNDIEPGVQLVREPWPAALGSSLM